MIEQTPPTLGVSIDELWAIIEARKGADSQDSYTARLLTGDEDQLLKKVGEEATEVVMAAKDAGCGRGTGQLRYEVVDLLYHTLVTCVRAGLTPAEITTEIRGRFK